MSEDKLPDGWIRTPLPPSPREGQPEASWFARTGEPAPQRTQVAPVESTENQRLAFGIAVLGLVFLGLFAFGLLFLLR